MIRTEGFLDALEFDDWRLLRLSFHSAHQNIMISLVRKKSEISTAIELTTTVRVVERPTPTVPPVVDRP